MSTGVNDVFLSEKQLYMGIEWVICPAVGYLGV
jgi:hypothetical protein